MLSAKALTRWPNHHIRLMRLIADTLQQGKGCFLAKCEGWTVSCAYMDAASPLSPHRSIPSSEIIDPVKYRPARAH
eukprot:1161301-Pelagomonas_calceolata.AAC.18